MDPMQLSLDAVLQQHNSLLEAHRKFLAGLKEHATELPAASEVLEVCASQTEMMVNAFQQCKSEFLRAQVPSEPLAKTSDAPCPQTNGATPPKSNGRGQAMDPSGFFMTDTNPTPIEDLLRGGSDKATTMPTRGKRKLEDEEMSGVPAGGEPLDGRFRKKKRATGSLSNKASRENLQSDTATKQEADEEHSVDDSFIRQFQERLAAKEERRRRKTDRKRKRDSGGSDSRAALSAEEHVGIKPERHRHKKAKTSGNASIATSETTNSAPFTPPTQSPQGAAQQDRGLKRPSPAAEYIGSLLANAERKRAKRQKT